MSVSFFLPLPYCTENISSTLYNKTMIFFNLTMTSATEETFWFIYICSSWICVQRWFWYVTSYTGVSVNPVRYHIIIWQELSVTVRTVIRQWNMWRQILSVTVISAQFIRNIRHLRGIVNIVLYNITYSMILLSNHYIRIKASRIS